MKPNKSNPLISRFFHANTLAAAVVLSLGALTLPRVAAESISVKFGSNEPNSTINTGSSLTAGAIPVAGTYWTNASGATGSAATLVDSTGATSGASVTWVSTNTWRSNSSGTPTATSQNSVLTKG
jgi:hypothetical protein